MEKNVLSGLEPKGVFTFFEQLCRIPHGSGNTAAASAWAMDFARTRGLRCRQDELGSVVIWKPASPGYEGHPAVVLQGHLDMVCVKDAGTAHDFEKDPLDLVVEGDWVRARGTTLGGDNGIAVAIILALLDDETAVHPPIEAVLTVDEEIGLLGANGLDCSDLAGRKLINIDSEDEGVLTVSCAGGSRCDIRQEFPLEEAEGAVCTLTVSGGQGGHSGIEIHKGLANASKLLGACLKDMPGIRLISLAGGAQDNAIPKEAEAVFLAEAIGICQYIFAPQLISLFDSTPGVVALGVRQARTVALFYCLLAFSHAIAAVCRGAGKAFVPMVIMLSVWCVIRIAYIVLVMRLVGDIGLIYWAYPLTWAISSVIYLVYYLRSDWTHGFD